MDAPTVLVYGATGTQGTPVVEHSLAGGRRVRVLTRQADNARHWAEQGAEVAVADLADPASLAAANDGVDEVVLQLPLQYDFTLHETYGRNAVDAAKAARVDLLVLNTSAHVFAGQGVRVYEARQEVVDHLQASGIPSIVLRPTFFMEILLGPWIRPGIVDNGVIAFPLPADLPMSWVSAAELGAYAVAALGHPQLAGRTFDIGGPQPLTGNELAACFSEVLQRPITFVPISPDDYENALVPVFGATVAHAVAAQVRCIAGRGTGVVEMAATAAEFSTAASAVQPLPLEQWIGRHRWDAG
jgi:NAD(P)H dehydrogenase (quinone)